jgi:hypothetical protein
MLSVDQLLAICNSELQSSRDHRDVLLREAAASAYLLQKSVWERERLLREIYGCSGNTMQIIESARRLLPNDHVLNDALDRVYNLAKQARDLAAEVLVVTEAS